MAHRTIDGTCPHCGQDASCLFGYGGYGMDDEPTNCPHCNGKIRVTTHIAYTIERRPKKVHGYCTLCGGAMMVHETDSCPAHARCIREYGQ